jgi:hypothetical protein
MLIECNQISQVINELLISFKDCNKIKNEDLRKMVELISAVNICQNGGPNYNTLITDIYEPIIDELVTYPINTFHSISIIVLNGNIIYNTFNFPSGLTQNIEFTTLNQTSISFLVKAGSKVIVEYIIETI